MIWFIGHSCVLTAFIYNLSSYSFKKPIDIFIAYKLNLDDNLLFKIKY